MWVQKLHERQQQIVFAIFRFFISSLKSGVFLIWNTALQEKWKSIYMHYFRSSYTERLSEVVHSNFDSLHFFMFFYPWFTNRHVKIFSLTYANLFYHCFVNNYRKVFILLKLSYFAKIFGCCLQPIIIYDVLFTSLI